jgi:hypothetical protein
VSFVGIGVGIGVGVDVDDDEVFDDDVGVVFDVVAVFTSFAGVVGVATIGLLKSPSLVNVFA